MDSTPPSKDTVWQTGLERRSNNLLFTKDPPYYRNKHWLRLKDWKKIYQTNGPQKQAGVAILTLDKEDFKLTLVK
jgi:hypothetical protein